MSRLLTTSGPPLSRSKNSLFGADIDVTKSKKSTGSSGSFGGIRDKFDKNDFGLGSDDGSLSESSPISKKKRDSSNDLSSLSLSSVPNLSLGRNSANLRQSDDTQNDDSSFDVNDALYGDELDFDPNVVDAEVNEMLGQFDDPAPRKKKTKKKSTTKKKKKKSTTQLGDFGDLGSFEDSDLNTNESLDLEFGLPGYNPTASSAPTGRRGGMQAERDMQKKAREEEQRAAEEKERQRLEKEQRDREEQERHEEEERQREEELERQRVADERRRREEDDRRRRDEEDRRRREEEDRRREEEREREERRKRDEEDRRRRDEDDRRRRDEEDRRRRDEEERRREDERRREQERKDKLARQERERKEQEERKRQDQLRATRSPPPKSDDGFMGDDDFIDEEFVEEEVVDEDTAPPVEKPAPPQVVVNQSNEFDNMDDFENMSNFETSSHFGSVPSSPAKVQEAKPVPPTTSPHKKSPRAFPTQETTKQQQPIVTSAVNMEQYERAIAELNTLLKTHIDLNHKTFAEKVHIDVSQFNKLQEMYDQSMQERSKLVTEIEELKTQLQKLEIEQKSVGDELEKEKDRSRLDLVQKQLENEQIIHALKLNFEQERHNLASQLSLDSQTMIQKITLECEKLKEELRQKDSSSAKDVERIEIRHAKEVESIEEKNRRDLASFAVVKEQEKRQLQQLFEMEKLSIERRQQEMIAEQRQLFREELEAKTRYMNIDHDLAELIKRVELNAHTVDTMHQKMTEEQYAILKGKEDQLGEREKMMRQAERALSEQNDHMERERARLQTLFMNMEGTMQSMQKSYEEERQRCRQEQSTLVQARISIEAEYKAKIDEMYTQREKLDEERSSFIHEKQVFLSKTHDERASLSKLRSEVTASQEHSLLEQAKKMKELNEREGEIVKLRVKTEEETSLMKERKLTLERERKHLVEEREKLERETEKFNKSAQELTKQALLVQQESESCNKKHQDAIKERVESQRLLGEVNITKASFEADKRKLEEMRRVIQVERKQLETERMSLGEAQTQINNSRAELNAKSEQLRKLEFKLNEEMRLATSMSAASQVSREDRKPNFSAIQELDDGEDVQIGDVEDDEEEEYTPLQVNNFFKRREDEEYNGLSKSVSNILSQRKAQPNKSMNIVEEISRLKQDRMRSSLHLKDQARFLEQINNKGMEPNGHTFVRLNVLDSTLKTSDGVASNSAPSSTSSPIAESPFM